MSNESKFEREKSKRQYRAIVPVLSSCPCGKFLSLW
jgi:hypothetical protein